MLAAIVCSIYFGQSIHAKMILLNVIFRHGDRAPESIDLDMYPNDPYLNKTFYPFGFGGLTNAGKLREYNLGRHIRKRYGDFLGDTYVPREVQARSTDIDRTKMSLNLVLASMYPPMKSQRWNEALNWQPIPTYYLPTLDDNLMIPQECPKYLKVREEVEASKEFRDKLSKFDSLMKNLTEFTGKSITSTIDMYYLYHGLKAESSNGLKLPEWTRAIFPYGQLYDGIVLEYQLESYNDRMKRLNGGMLLRKITDDMTSACTAKPNPKRKVYLYSGHEFNIAALLQALGVYYPHVPRYSSALFIELHENEKNKNHFVRVIYYRGHVVPEKGELLEQVMQVPGCRQFCPFEKLKNALSNVIAKDSDIPCDKRSLKAYLESNRTSLPYGVIKPLLGNLYKEESFRNTLH